MTNNQYIEKILLDYQTELNGMIAENRQRELSGFAPAYVERHFRKLMYDYHNCIMNFGE